MGKIESKQVQVIGIGAVINNILNLIITIPCIIVLSMLMFKLDIVIHDIYYVVIMMAVCYIFGYYINSILKVRDYFKYRNKIINIYYSTLDEINMNFIKRSFKIIESIDNTVIFINKDDYDLLVKYKEINNKYTLYDYDYTKPHTLSTNDNSYINYCIEYAIKAYHYFNPINNGESVTLEELSNLKHTLMVLHNPYNIPYGEDTVINYIHAIYWMVDYMNNNGVTKISSIKVNE